VLADEPTARLDEKNEGIVLRSLADLRDRFESTIVVVTHSDRVAAACDGWSPFRTERWPTGGPRRDRATPTRTTLASCEGWRSSHGRGLPG